MNSSTDLTNNSLVNETTHKLGFLKLNGFLFKKITFSPLFFSRSHKSSAGLPEQLEKQEDTECLTVYMFLCIPKVQCSDSRHAAMQIILSVIAIKGGKCYSILQRENVYAICFLTVMVILLRMQYL